MAIVVLDKEKHANLKIVPNPSCAHMRNKQLTLVTISEFTRAANNFPIVVIKDENSGAFGTVALFGFKAGENLMYGAEQWKCSYAPMSMWRHPFILAHDEKDPEPNRLSLCFEDDQEYINEKEGSVALYKEDGQESDVLKNFRQLIGDLFEREKATYRFMEKMIELNLLKQFSLQLTMASGQKRQVKGMHTIDAKRLAELSDEQVLEFHRNGYLRAVNTMLDSLGQFNLLMKYKNLAGGDETLTYFELVFDQDEAPKSS